ncbi:hypothetical protein DEO72_LG11g1685 [Vigna unguiculata]|uniref:Uncharacterized protein n=1 Tax=Vigna unguiculata TaxID=3917 RepID=A0A4D6NP10_VIGUN|nr:hypothetical protein DEO72_LG11g1685 [Vigna unguiculata]
MGWGVLGCRPNTTGLRVAGGMPGCQVTTAQCTPTHHPSPSIHTGWVVASENRTPNLTFNTSGKPADATSCAGLPNQQMLPVVLVCQRC